MPFTDQQVAQHWDANAATWAMLVRQGWDHYRDYLNSPAFFHMLPDVRGLSGLDIGCGEGHNARLLSRRCGRVTAIDIAPTFVQLASTFDNRQPPHTPVAIDGIDGQPPALMDFQVASAQQLPFADESFDFAISCMAMMDVPDPATALREAARVIRPGGFVQFSVSHPATTTPHRRQVKDDNGRPCAMEIGRYFERVQRVERWLFSAAPASVKQGLEPFTVPYVHRTLADWLNMVSAAGLRIEEVQEPAASDEIAQICPTVRDTQMAPYFLHIRARRA